MNREQRRRCARVEEVQTALQKQADGVNDGLRGFTERMAAGIDGTLVAWRTANVDPLRRRVNAALAVAFLALVVAVLGVLT